MADNYDNDSHVKYFTDNYNHEFTITLDDNSHVMNNIVNNNRVNINYIANILCNEYKNKYDMIIHPENIKLYNKNTGSILHTMSCVINTSNIGIIITPQCCPNCQ